MDNENIDEFLLFGRETHLGPHNAHTSKGRLVCRRTKEINPRICLVPKISVFQDWKHSVGLKLRENVAKTS